MGVSQARSWSPWLVLGAILWVRMPNVDNLCSNLTFEIPPRRALRGFLGSVTNKSKEEEKSVAQRGGDPGLTNLLGGRFRSSQPPLKPSTSVSQHASDRRIDSHLERKVFRTTLRRGVQRGGLTHMLGLKCLELTHMLGLKCFEPLQGAVLNEAMHVCVLHFMASATISQSPYKPSTFQ